MEQLNNIWNYVLPIGGGLTVGGIIVFIGALILKSYFGKLVGKIGIDNFVKKVEDTQREAAEKAVEKVKEISFKQSIQPIVESGLEKVNEKANEYIEKEVGELRESNNRLVNAIEALGAYFDDSIVPDAKKQAFREAIEAAKSPTTEQEFIVQESPVEATTTAPAAKKSTKKSEVIR